MICADPLLLFSGCRSQDKIVFMSLINSEKGNKSSKKITLRALVTERLSRAKCSLELFYSSPLKLTTNTRTQIHLLTAVWKGLEEDPTMEKMKGAPTRDANNFGANQHIVSQQLQLCAGVMGLQ